MLKEITLTTPDGFTLNTLYHEGTNGKGVVFAHGLGWYKEGEEPFMNAADILAQRGYSTLLFDFRASGKSSGVSEKDFTVSGQLLDIDTVIHFLQENTITTIYLAGASFGAGAVTLYAENNQTVIKKLLLLNPSLDYMRSVKKHFINQLGAFEKDGFIEVHKEKYRLGRKLFEELQTFVPYEALEKYKNDVCIIHGDKDTLIPYQSVLSNFEKLKNPKKKFKLIHEANHGFHEDPYQTEATKYIVDFLLK